MPRKVERTRNANTWTEAKYWGHIRSHLRRAFRFWKPATDAKLKARRPHQGSNKDKELRCSKLGGKTKHDKNNILSKQPNMDERQKGKIRFSHTKRVPPPLQHSRLLICADAKHQPLAWKIQDGRGHCISRAFLAMDLLSPRP